MKSNTEKGNAFRDLVDGLLVAAGFFTKKEQLVGPKAVDVSLWVRDEVGGPTRYLIETKSLQRTLGIDDCSIFVGQYGTLLRSGQADQAWLVSRGPISPEGAALIAANPGLRAFTYESFQRQLLLLDRYLRTIIDEARSAGLADFYVRPKTLTGDDLETSIRAWMAGSSANPMAVLGDYGVGKSTFALHLASKLAEEALDDPTCRAPILVRLGDLVDEQSVEGLIGKTLSSRYRVNNYHFQNFAALNKIGRFLLIFDGLDEMHHGMTPNIFGQCLNELMRLDCAAARIVLLGRPEVFYDDDEFQAFVGAREPTGSGRWVRTPRRGVFSHIGMRGFELSEARAFVAKFFPWKARAAAKGEGIDITEAWISSRCDDLLSGKLDELLSRPVHAQMLCEIAMDPLVDLRKQSEFELFDTFLHYLLRRELEKRGRDGRFTEDIRRDFNARLAWWILERGRSQATTLAEIPIELCRESTKSVRHDLDDSRLKRELVAGCFVEKQNDNLYYGHRSLQEFLVGEWLVGPELIAGRFGKEIELDKVLSLLNNTIIGFVVGGVSSSEYRRSAGVRWMRYLESYRTRKMPLHGFHLFVRLAIGLKDLSLEPDSNPWHIWLRFFLSNGATEIHVRSGRALETLTSFFKALPTSSAEFRATVLLLTAQVLLANRTHEQALLPIMLVNWLLAALQEERDSTMPLGEAAVTRSNLLETFKKCVSTEQARDGEKMLSIDLLQARKEVAVVGSTGFDLGGDTYHEAHRFGLCAFSSFEAAQAALDVPGDTLAKMRDIVKSLRHVHLG